MNNEIKFIHRKRNNKQDPMVDDLKSRKRMEILIETNCERQKVNYTKSNDIYWERTILENNAVKKDVYLSK